MDEYNFSEGIDQDRRRLLGAATLGIAAAGAVSLLPSHLMAAPATDAIRPFRVHFSDSDLVDLRRRIVSTRWPDQENVTDDSQGVRLATMRKLAQHWQTSHDWRKVEARLNALPQFVTEIDGLDIHFIHVRSTHDQRVADDRHAWMARLRHRADENHRSADESHRARRERR